jgi:hypothetical protein
VISILAALALQLAPAHALEIVGGKLVDENTISLELRYKGCGPHRFRIESSGVCLHSYPAQTGAELIDATPDECDAVITDSVELKVFSNCRPAFFSVTAGRGDARTEVEVLLPDRGSERPRRIHSRDVEVVSAKRTQCPNSWREEIELEVRYPSCTRQAHDFYLRWQDCAAREDGVPQGRTVLVDKMTEEDCKTMVTEKVILDAPTWKLSRECPDAGRKTLLIQGKDEATSATVEFDTSAK